MFKSFLVKKAFKFEKIIEGFEAEIVKRLFLFFQKGILFQSLLSFLVFQFLLF